jgi:hypothetical protein
MQVLNHDWLAEAADAVDYAYQVFGTGGDLVMTYGTDSICPARGEYAGGAAGVS